MLNYPSELTMVLATYTTFQKQTVQQIFVSLAS